MDKKMDKKMIFVVLGIVAVFAAVIGVSLWQSRSNPTDFEGYNLGEVIAADDQTGGFEEMIAGDKDAPIKIFEYGDYQCTACAPTNPYVNQIIEEYDGQVAVVFRLFIMSYHQNGTAAASAALAAAKQGYWQEYKDLLFANQNDWYYSDAATRQQQFEEYFEKVTNGKGDLEKFRKDMLSDEVKQKIAFDRGLYEKQTAADNETDQWTPMFYVGGKLIDQRDMKTEDFLNALRSAIDAEMKERGIEKKK